MCVGNESTAGKIFITLKRLSVGVKHKLNNKPYSLWNIELVYRNEKSLFLLLFFHNGGIKKGLLSIFFG